MATIPSWQSIALLALLVVITHPAIYFLWRHHGGRLAAGTATPAAGRGGLVLAAAICAVLFFAMTAVLFASGFVDSIDTQVRTWVEVLHDGMFMRFCLFVTSMGSIPTMLAVTLVAAGMSWAHARRRDVAGLAVSAIGSQATTYIAKYAIDRPRPHFDALVSAATPSFPSGHTTVAVGVYGFILWLIVCRLPRERLRFEFAYWGGALILLIVATRVLLGVHFVSDVVAGMLLGMFWLLAGLIVSRRRPFRSFLS